MKKYRPTDTETKWQVRWSKQNLYQTDLSQPNHKYYVLVELAYTSGDLHMGHWFTFTHGDIIARFKRMLGHNVVFPNGFDAFGLPAENAAIKRNIHPSDWTYDNVLRMRAQFDTLGSSIDWTKTIVACDPQYYKWNQWMFLRMLEKGLAYRGKLLSNWCPSCETVLANENVEVGKCWRCGTKVIQKEIEQWFFKITDYADRLIWQNPPQADWPKSLTEGQNKWIGKSEGLLLKFQIDSNSANNNFIEVFTTRPDTIFGTTFIVISPEHPLLPEIIASEQRKIVTSYINQSKTKTELERNQNKDKTGVFTGAYVKNPLSGEAVPVWVADYVLTGYGTGAVMGVPAHDSRDFEFAKKFGLPVKPVIQPDGVKQSNRPLAEVFEDEGVVVKSGQFTGMKSAEARETISKYIVDNKYGSYKTQYHLHDWSISRQRYWGTPIPIIYCDNCGVVPVPDEDLPVELPYKVDYAPKGQAPLATAASWVKVKCPKCQGNGRREVETMDTFVDSSWYFFRYLDPSNQVEIFDKQIIKNWLPVDIYIGGAEHTLGHALYSRFFTMVFHDLGLISFDEYAKRRIHHGTILGTDGSKMSKSRGNIINPDEQVKEYGADAVRTYLAFLGPYDIVAAWNPSGVNAVYHFIERVWNLYEGLANQDKLSAQDLQIMHKTIKKVTSDIENIKFNTAIAAMMEWLNHLSRKSHNRQLSKAEYLVLLKLLCPFAPHITEELWEMLGQPFSIHQQSWPEFDEAFLQLDKVSIVVQVNGKVRDSIVISKEILNDSKEIEQMVKNSPKVQKYLAGNQIKKSIYIPGKIINLVI